MNPRPAAVRPIFWWLLASVTIGLRFWGLDHGLPRNFLPDTTVVRAALSLGAGTNPFVGEALPTQYPYLLPYVLAAVFGAVYVVGRLAGWFPNLEAFEAFALSRPEVFFLIARGIVAMAGCGVVLLVVLCARRLSGDRAGLLAGWLTATSLILVQLSHQARPHMVTAFWIMLCLWSALRFQERWLLGYRGSWDYVMSWLAAAAAGATTPYGFLGLLIPATLWWRFQRPGKRLLKSTSAAVSSAAMLILICYPRLVLKPEVSFGYDRSSGTVRYFDGLLVAPRFINGGGFEKLAGWLASYEPAVAILLIPACVGLFRDRSRWRRWVPLLIYPAAFTLVYGLYEVIYPRYLVSLIPFFALIIAPLAEKLGRRSRAHRVVTLGLLLMMAVPLVQAARLDFLLSRQDTRLTAEDWIERNIPASHILAIESHGVSPEPDVASLRAMAERHGDQLGVKDARRLRADSREGRSLRRLWFDDGYRQASVAQQGSKIRWVAAVVQADEPRTDPFYGSLPQPPIVRMSPVAEGAEASGVETRLPAELQNPLRGLWQVERCGPIVEIYRLDQTPRATAGANP